MLSDVLCEQHAYYDLLRVPSASEKLCTNHSKNCCYGARLVKQVTKQPIKGLVAVKDQRAIKKTDVDPGFCLACYVAEAHKAAMEMLHSGYPKTVNRGCPTDFQQCIRVECSATANDSSFMPDQVWTAPFVYNSSTKEETHFGTVCHMPLLIANLRSENGRLVPPGHKYEDGLLVRHSECGTQPPLPTSFFS